MNRTQQGWTFWSLLGVSFLIVVVALLFMKLMPVYMDNYKIVEAMHSVAEDPRARKWTKSQVVREMTNILYIDYGADIVDLNKALTLDKNDAQQFIKVDYEIVVPLVYNVSALLNFNNEVEIPR